MRDHNIGSFQKSGALLWTPTSRALIKRTPTRRDPQFMVGPSSPTWRNATARERLLPEALNLQLGSVPLAVTVGRLGALIFPN